MRYQKNANTTNITNKKPEIVDNRKPKLIDIQTANQPVRAVNFVEVGELTPTQVQYLIQELNKSHKTAQGGIHYFVPIRNGKITTDILFEEEWLQVVRDTCEIKNDQIVLKDGSKQVTVIRQKI